MNTTTAEYLVSVRTDEGTLSVLRTMPTRPKTQKGIKSQNNKLEKWAMERYPTGLKSKSFLHLRFPNELHSQATPRSCQSSD